MNKMKASRQFYTVAVSASESVPDYINCVRNLGENVKAMGGELKEMAVSLLVLNGLMSK